MAAVILLALAGTGLVLLSTARYGAGVSPDSVDYFDVARSLESGKGLVFHTGKPLVWWPPLYPMLLALVGFATRLEPGTFAHIVNAVLFALVIYLSSCLFRSSFRQNTTYSLLGLCVVLFSIPLSGVYAMAWSECLFIPLVLLCLIFAQRYWFRRGVLSLAVMTLSTALACLTRYVGLSLVLAGAVTVLLASGLNIKARLVRASAFAVLSLLPLGFWVMHNYRLTGTLFGHRGPVLNTFADSFTFGAGALLSWYAPLVPEARSTGLTVGVLVALAGTIGLATSFLLSRAVRKSLRSSLKAVLRDHMPVFLFLLIYTIVLLTAATRDAYVETRTLSPIYIPLSLVLLKLAYFLFSPSQPAGEPAAGKVPSMLLAVWLCFVVTDVASSTVRRFKTGAGGLNAVRWRESETVAYAKQMVSTEDDVHVYSNGTDALWELARVDASEFPSRAEVSLSELRGRWPAEGASVLVWFNNRGWRRDFYSVEELKEITDLEEIARFSDGSIYRVSVRDTVAPNWSHRASNGNTLPDSYSDACQCRLGLSRFVGAVSYSSR